MYWSYAKFYHRSAGFPGPNVGPFISDPSAPEVQSAEAYGKALFDSQSFEDWSKLEDLLLAPIFFVTSAFLGLLAASVEGGMENATASVINNTSAVTHFDISHGVVSRPTLHRWEQAYSCLVCLRLIENGCHSARALNGARFRFEGIPSSCQHNRTGTIPFPAWWIARACWCSNEIEAGCDIAYPSRARRKVTDKLISCMCRYWQICERDLEIAAIAIYLASSAAAYTNGQDIAIDGSISLVNP